MIHRNYTRLAGADRAVIDAAFNAAVRALKDDNRHTDMANHAERLVEALATYLIEGGGAARVGDKATHTAPVGREHESYGE